MSEPTMLSYVYAIGRYAALAEVPATLADLAGVAESRVRTVGDRELAAVVSSVPSADFDDNGFRAQLEDLAGLELIARAHHAVVDHLARRATVLPLRLATVYRDDANVARMLHESEARFGALLQRLDGRAEWGVKVYACPGGTDGGEGEPPAPAAGAALSPGRAYLRQRRAQRSRHRDAFRAAADTAEHLARLADAHAADRLPHRPQSGELATGEGENVSNVSYLVPRERAEEFRAAAEAAGHAADGVRVEVTGPWAPYSFAEAPSAPAMEGSGGR